MARARHIEVQIFGDGRGNVIALGERDCSVQRRNQKVIEETPAPGLPTEVRSAVARMRGAAGRSGELPVGRHGRVRLRRRRGEFYFLEVNTRLQVEHGVTEEVTGVDLVEWMVRRRRESPPKPVAQGHSIQVRVYAEDPGKNFQPSAGTSDRSRISAHEARVETWVEREPR